MNVKRFSRIADQLVSLLAIPVFLGTAWAQHLQSFSFNGKDGNWPQGGLVVDNVGNFYGGTAFGGVADLGVVYKINPISETTLYNFTGSNGDGANPIGDLILDKGGNLYGVTQYGGGGNCALGCGTVFELSPPASQGGAWTETVLWTFLGNSNGAYPLTGLVFDDAGNLYGTTVDGGLASNLGTVFELAPPSQPGGTWTQSVLYSFGGYTSDGSHPNTRLVMDQAGNLYGTTPNGVQSFGTVFELSPPISPGGAWTEAVLHHFWWPGPAYPEGGLTWGPDGVLFGTTSDGTAGGTVFRLSPASGQGEWTYYDIYTSQSIGGAHAPLTYLSPNTLFGTTFGGGSASVFKIFYSGGMVTETDIYDLGPSLGGVVLYNGALYGTTGNGVSNGTVYRLSSNSRF